MKKATRKFLIAISSLAGSYVLGMMVYFILRSVGDLSRASSNILIYFGIEFVASIILYVIFWAKTHNNPSTPLTVIFCIIGCILTAVTAFICFITLVSDNSGMVDIAIIVNTILALGGQVCAYVFGKVNLIN